MRIRAATLSDAPAMGRVMVESWLSAHRGQMPDEAFQRRVEEWTPEVSARGWARALTEQAVGIALREVFLVAEDDEGVLIGLASGAAAADEPSGSTAEIGSLYVLPDRRGRGVGGSLLRAACRELGDLGFGSLHIGVLAANLPARAFYEAMGGREVEQRTFDEEGHLLPLTIYVWPDLTTLADGG
jgi:ribosomal protein S18 acetylase RimI-like enzyme